MKRLSTMLVFLVGCFFFSFTAAANVFFENPNREMDVKFKGIEYVFDNNGALVKDVATLLTGTGLSMSGFFYVDSIQLTDGNGNPTSDPALYYSSNGDAYIGVLSGLTIASVDPGTSSIYFSGGTLEWYYSKELNREDIIGIRWSEQKKSYVDANGNTVDFSAMTPYVTYELTYGEYSGKASVTVYPNGTSLDANFTAYGDVIPTAGLPEWMYDYFDNNKYEYDARYGYGASLHDMTLRATLEWDGGSESQFFRVNDPARMSTTATPEPGTILLMGAGLVGLGVMIRRRRQQQ